MDDEKIQTFVLPEHYKNATVICSIQAHKDTPVSARVLAKVFTNHLRLLESLDKNKNGGKRTIEWVVSDLNVIGDRASFAVTGWPIGQFNRTLKEAKAKAEEVKKT